MRERDSDKSRGELLDITNDTEDFLDLHVVIDGSNERFIVREASELWKP